MTEYIHPTQTLRLLLTREQADLKREFNRTKKLPKSRVDRQPSLTRIYCRRRELEATAIWLENHEHIHVRQ